MSTSKTYLFKGSCYFYYYLKYKEHQKKDLSTINVLLMIIHTLSSQSSHLTHKPCVWTVCALLNELFYLYISVVHSIFASNDPRFLTFLEA